MKWIPLLLLALLPTIALADGPADDPASVVLRFVVHDRNGARLTSSGWQRIDGLMENPTPSRWNSTFVVDGYRLGSVVHEGDTARVTIIYRDLGRVTGDRWQPADGGGNICEETVEYVLQRRNGHWLILRANTPPHVSASALCALVPGAPICPQ